MRGWLDLVACPVCHGALDADGRSACGERWDVRDGVGDFVPRDVERLVPAGDVSWERWREALAGLEAWRARRRAPAAPGPSPVDPRITALVAAASLAGVVVDVGGKDGAKRFAMPPAVTRYLSVDPCASGAAPDGHPLPWLAVRGLAEALPVRSGAADAVFSTAAMDYFVDPARAVGEFARVLRPGGTLALLVTTHAAPVARARERPTRAGRALAALAPPVLAAVGARGALALAADGARAAAREHARYVGEAELLAWLAPRFEVRRRERDPGAYSTVERVVATRR